MTSATVTSAAVERALAGRGTDWRGLVFLVLLLGSLILTIAILLTLIIDQAYRAIPVFQERGIDFLTAPLSPDPAEAGVGQGIVGTIVIGVLVSLFCFPLGILTAVYLEEYAPDNRLTRIINVNIRNLAGVPSIVYGLLGLTVFVAFFAALGFPNNGRNIIAGALTLTALILPIVIITSAEALRAVPRTLREGGYGVGASRWEVTRKLVLPAATPGILTGTILALAQGARRDRPAPPGRGDPRDLLQRGRAREPADRALHRPADDGLRLVAPTAGGVPGPDVGGHHRAPVHHPVLQRRRHLPPQPVPEVVVASGSDPQGSPMTTQSEAPALDPSPPSVTIDLGGERASQEDMASLPTAVALDGVSIYYGSFRAVKDITVDLPKHRISAIIGPSGCGKSTLLRSINRMNDLVPSARVEGRMDFHGENLYADYVDPVEVRRRIGMVFQKPNPFPKSIYDNVAFGPRITGYKGNMDDLVESCLRRAVIWDEVKDKLKQSGLTLSGGQQQRLCIARAIATEPDVILMDEPCSALDPRSTLQIEDLMAELKENYTIIIVTHNMQQAARASDFTVFLTMDTDRAGYLVEQGPTMELFTNPKDKLTEDYVSGRFG